jgi:hypothetical protein
MKKKSVQKWEVIDSRGEKTHRDLTEIQAMRIARILNGTDSFDGLYKIQRQK